VFSCNLTQIKNPKGSEQMISNTDFILGGMYVEWARALERRSRSAGPKLFQIDEPRINKLIVNTAKLNRRHRMP